MQENATKRNGVHFTPTRLADFLATEGIKHLNASRIVRILDPACGDGQLLRAAVEGLKDRVQSSIEVVGFETNALSAENARDRLTDLGVGVSIHHRDFLECVTLQDRNPLFSSDDIGEFDFVISNPPYVRTQVMGADRSQALSETFALTGRVDLYQAFVCAMTSVLRPGGVLALLISNRFMSTRSGLATRELLRTKYSLKTVVDLGDTKLFEAAVLPSIIVGTRSSASLGANNFCEFLRIYESKPSDDVVPTPFDSVLEALAAREERYVTAANVTYRIEAGRLADSEDHSKPWVLSGGERHGWLERVRSNTACLFGDLARIRVGIKTTADSVFLKEDWGTVPAATRPEAELLRPLITRKAVNHFGVDRVLTDATRVLYPYTARPDGTRRLVDLADFPHAMRYLEANRDRLEGRSYVTAGGRAWFEIWVPQQPSLWPRPKLVFPDISEFPRFTLDLTGAVVNGDCYWIVCNDGIDSEWLWLMLAVANSSLIVHYYDAIMHNKLYSGKRRFITQYVKEFPLPTLGGAASQRAIAAVKEFVHNNEQLGSPRCLAILDAHVAEAFGLPKEFLRQGNLDLLIDDISFEPSKELEEVSAGDHDNVV